MNTFGVLMRTMEQVQADGLLPHGAEACLTLENEDRNPCAMKLPEESNHEFAKKGCASRYSNGA